jgi:hypothetical protein
MWLFWTSDFAASQAVAAAFVSIALLQGRQDAPPITVDSRSKNKSEVVSFLCGTSPIQRSFQANSVVIARGLVARSDLNGKRCVITGSFSEASGRWPVRFDDSGEEKISKTKTSLERMLMNLKAIETTANGSNAHETRELKNIQA